MGIEPTSRTVNARLSGFEDRGRHQANRHFRDAQYSGVATLIANDECRNSNDESSPKLKARMTQAIYNFANGVSFVICNSSFDIGFRLSQRIESIKESGLRLGIDRGDVLFSRRSLRLGGSPFAGFGRLQTVGE